MSSPALIGLKFWYAFNDWLVAPKKTTEAKVRAELANSKCTKEAQALYECTHSLNSGETDCTQVLRIYNECTNSNS